MQIIDSHTHVDEYEAFGWYDPPEAMIELLDEAGIEKAVVMTYADAPVLKPDAGASPKASCVTHIARSW